MRITKVYIKQFRNLKDVKVEFTNNLAVYGNNRIGKTNFLQAIYWCLFGVDLTLSSNDSKNLPDDGNFAEVELTFDSRDVLTRALDSAHTQIVLYNGVQMKKSEVEKTIFKTQYEPTKEFNSNRFFVNPQCLKELKESDFRKWYVKTLNVSIEELYKNSNEMIREKLANFEKLKYSVEDLSKALRLEEKRIKGEYDKWYYVSEYLKEFMAENTKANEQANVMVHIARKELQENEEKQQCLDLFTFELSKAYQEKTDVVLLEKGIGNNVWKEKCKPLIAGTDRYWDNGSTAEQIISLVRFVEKLNVDLPILIDEAECLDNNSLANLSESTHCQLIVSKVQDGYSSIQFKEF